jgi:hypothetical protein
MSRQNPTKMKEFPKRIGPEVRPGGSGKYRYTVSLRGPSFYGLTINAICWTERARVYLAGNCFISSERFPRNTAENSMFDPSSWTFKHELVSVHRIN